MKTKKIKFNLERWQSGDFVRVETRGGKEVKQLTYFHEIDGDYKLLGVLDGGWASNHLDGSHARGGEDELDLFLIVKDDDEKVGELFEDLWIYTLAKRFIEQYERENK